MTPKLPKQKQIKILRELLTDPSIFFGRQTNNIIQLLDHLFDLRAKPSEDSRFKDAYGDAVQHLVNNADWELEHVLLNRFDITEGDNFFKMIEYLVRPDFQTSEQSRLDLVDKINTFITSDGYILETSGFNESEQPLFSFSEFNPENRFPAGVVRNQIKIYPNYNFNDLKNFRPTESDFFVLNFIDFNWWNDYSLLSRCNLIYKDGNGSLTNYGELKIITNNADNYTDSQDEKGNFRNFNLILPESFTELDDSFCSLGQERNYYLALKETFQSKFRSILYALKDAAFFTDIADLFEKEYYFKHSLIRADRAERILREIRHETNGRNREDMYRFTYLFSPNFGDINIPPIPISFDFEDSSDIPNRICAIIGKNGVGKTQFISQIPRNLANEDAAYFQGNIPLFSKIIALSYSPFDTFKPSKSGLNVDYIFCSLRDEFGELRDDQGRAIKFGRTRKRIEELERIEDWMGILSEFLPGYYIREIFERVETGYKVNSDKLNSLRKQLSSGQRILLETVTNVIAHIRFDSLLLFDEPETHLHPNAIAQLMNTIYELVKRFESFCILTTHSPIIIRELLSKNVYVFDRADDFLAVRKIGVESFGANLSDITEEIFGTNEIPKHYQVIIRRLHDMGKSVEEIIEAVRSGNIPVSLNLRLFIRSLFEENP